MAALLWNAVWNVVIMIFITMFSPHRSRITTHYKSVTPTVSVIITTVSETAIIINPSCAKYVPKTTANMNTLLGEIGEFIVELGSL